MLCSSFSHFIAVVAEMACATTVKWEHAFNQLSQLCCLQSSKALRRAFLLCNVLCKSLAFFLTTVQSLHALSSAALVSMTFQFLPRIPHSGCFPLSPPGLCRRICILTWMGMVILATLILWHNACDWAKSEPLHSSAIWFITQQKTSSLRHLSQLSDAV